MTPAGSLVLDPDEVPLVWFLLALGVSCLPSLLLWDWSRALPVFPTCSERFAFLVPNFLSLENYQLALIPFLLNFAAKRST